MIMSGINQFCRLIISNPLLQPKSSLDLPVLMTYSYQSNTSVDVGCKMMTIISLRKVEDDGKEPSICKAVPQSMVQMTVGYQALNATHGCCAKQWLGFPHIAIANSLNRKA